MFYSELSASKALHTVYVLLSVVQRVALGKQDFNLGNISVLQISK